MRNITDHKLKLKVRSSKQIRSYPHYFNEHKNSADFLKNYGLALQLYEFIRELVNELMTFESFIANLMELPFYDTVCFEIHRHSAEEENVFSCLYITFIISKFYIAKFISCISFLS